MTAHTIQGPDDFATAFGVTAETIARLVTYETLLKQWQKAVNLVAPSTLDDIWHRHFADSAQLVALAPVGLRSWIDLGSGGGFPGLVCAILLADLSSRERGEERQQAPTAPSPLRGGWREAPGGGATGSTINTPTPNPSPQGGGESRVHLTLIESDTRKAAFLREVVRAVSPLPGIDLEILPARAESVKTQVNFLLPRVVSARALAPLEKLLALAFPLSPPGTTGLFSKGKEVAQEIDAAKKTWNFDVDLVPSVTEGSGRIAVITNLERKAKD
jgi:16S rRNA (guanine527-N7)-methyltransferase